MLTFSILSVPEKLYTVFIIMLYFGIPFSAFLKTLNQKSSEFSDNWAIKICCVIQLKFFRDSQRAEECH